MRAKCLCVRRSGRQSMMRSVRLSLSKSGGCVIPGRMRENMSSTKVLGNGHLILEQMPCMRASSMESHRCMPRLCTTMSSGVSGDESGVERDVARACERTSSRLLSMSFRLGNCIPLQ